MARNERREDDGRGGVSTITRPGVRQRPSPPRPTPEQGQRRAGRGSAAVPGRMAGLRRNPQAAPNVTAAPNGQAAPNAQAMPNAQALPNAQAAPNVQAAPSARPAPRPAPRPAAASAEIGRAHV